MSNLRLHLSDPSVVSAPPPFRQLGHHLLMDGVISADDLTLGLDLQADIAAHLGEILIDKGLLTRKQMLSALAQQYNAQLVDLDASPPAPRLASKISAQVCLRHEVVPWLQIDDVLLIATSKPAAFPAFQAEMGTLAVQMLPVIADEAQIRQHLGNLYGEQLAVEAATRIPASQSCRTWQINPTRRRLWAWGGGDRAVRPRRYACAPMDADSRDPLGVCDFDDVDGPQGSSVLFADAPPRACLARTRPPDDRSLSDAADIYAGSSVKRERDRRCIDQTSGKADVSQNAIRCCAGA